MFFSPLIKNLIKKNDNISELEKNFIHWFIKIGYFNIILLIISIVTQILHYVSKLSILQTISFILTIVLWISLVVWSIYAISNKEILKNNNQINKKEQKTDLLENILYYIPIYNIYIRYKKHEFENANLILKKSIVVRTIFTILLIFSNKINLIFIIITFIVLRVISLTNWINWWDNVKKIINSLFKKNPEEIRAYFKWTIITVFNKKNIKENIALTKNKFSLIPKIEYRQMLLQYIILLIILGFWLYKSYINWSTNTIIALILILSRYLMMIIKRKHVPNLPIIKEVTDLFFKHKI